MSAEQTTGTASSYARKYALNGLFLIDETEQDADSQKPTNETKPNIKELEENAKAKLIVCKDLNELRTVYSSLPKLEQTIQSVIELKEKLKTTLK